MEEARDESPASGYKLYKSTKMLTIWRKKIGSENLYRVKMVGYLRHPIELVKEVVFDNKNRILWDSVLEDIRELGAVNEFQRLVHFITKPKYGLSKRDFVNLRTTANLAEAFVVVDVAATNSSVPLIDKAVRGSMLISGGALEECVLPHTIAKTPEKATKYSMISEIDFKGTIPKVLVNLLSSKVISDWFDELTEACAQWESGVLQQKKLGKELKQEKYSTPK